MKDIYGAINELQERRDFPGVGWAISVLSALQGYSILLPEIRFCSQYVRKYVLLLWEKATGAVRCICKESGRFWSVRLRNQNWSMIRGLFSVETVPFPALYLLQTRFSEAC